MPASSGDSTHGASDGQESRPRRNRRPRRRELLCPAHPDQRMEGNGRKYFLHLLSPEQLRQRGMNAKRARLVLQAYPVLVLSNEWLEELFCPACGSSRWCHVIRNEGLDHSVRWAARDLWEQVAHVDPVVANPSVSEYSRREARRHRDRRVDGGRWRDA
ncbi:hypothetical protein [Synechococcus sp. CS-1328]|uniref:hypothetical protein n=1 Tax=Synechococcus sp. CS-1328 TaxID=2847976 RepID=UPI00223AA74F|nr:hypothetical protein [Synechococcus sp. CS-1328]MCT0225936.1 hypothetical protein [Synechococcus sp. CS-1328]